MEIISEDQFRAYKQSDTIIVYGSGASINKLDKDDQKSLSSYDSIGFNWFCKSGIPVTFYVIREQCVPSKREVKGETLKCFLSYMNSDTYIDACKIIHKAKYLVQANGYSHFGAHSRILGKGMIVKDIKVGADKATRNRKKIIKSFKDDVVDCGVQHGTISMYNIMHIVTYFGYKNIIFAGVDLYDSRYFWIKEGETRRAIKDKGRSYKARHVAAQKTLMLLKLYKKYYPDIKMFTYNKKSLLKKYIPVWGS